MAGGRVLIVSWGGGGNFPPAEALADRLVRCGHEVAVIADAAPADRSVVESVTSCGAQLFEYRSVEPWPAGLSLEEDPVRFDEMRNGVPTAKDILAAAVEFQPHVMVVDCMIGAGLVAAEELGLPTAVLVHVLYQPFVSYWADISVDVSRCRKAFGMPDLDAPVAFEQLKRCAKVLVLVPEAFDYPEAPRTDETHYVGPIFSEHPAAPLDDLGFHPSDDRPLVLVSLSTTPMRQREALPPILGALGGLPVRGLVTLGGIAVDLQCHSVPDNVVVHDYLPHAAVLPQVSAVVTHAGLSTVMAALAHGIPLVCIPQGREQPLNAERVHACGAGISVAMDAKPEVIASAIETVLGEPSHKSAAESVAAAINALGRGQAAVDHVQSLLTRAPRRADGGPKVTAKQRRRSRRER